MEVAGEAISDEAYAEIDALIESGMDVVDKGGYDEGIQRYRRALSLIPPPADRFELYPYLMTLLGDAYFMLANYAQAEKCLLRALMNDYHANAMTTLRMGQVAFELGKREASMRFLVNAYMLKGADIFADEDPKYWEFAKGRVAELSSGQTWTEDDMISSAVRSIKENAPALAEQGWSP